MEYPKVTPEHIESIIVSEDYYVFPGTTFTSCLLTLKNGFTVHGQSACAHPDNFDAGKGQKQAREDAISKIWTLEGYLLKQRLYEQQ